MAPLLADPFGIHFEVPVVIRLLPQAEQGREATRALGATRPGRTTCWENSVYSERNTAARSIRAARSAGRTLAAIASSTMRAATPARVAGSSG